jgi:hypothetical protein
LIAIAAIAVVAAGVAAYTLWPVRPLAPPASEAVTTLSDATVQNRLALATASLQGRNYRAAAAYAAEVLAVNPGNQEATKIRDEAQAMLERFDAAIADARQRILARDVTGAARALESARALDPSAPVIVELGARLNELAARTDVGVRSAQRPAPASPAPAVPAPAASAPPVAPAAPEHRTAPAPAAPPVPEQRTAPSAPAASVVPAPVVPAPAAPAPAAPAPAPDRPAPGTAVAPGAPPAPSAPAAPDPDDAIRRLAATYARAIEGKDLALFRSIKPNLSREEERRLQDGFRAVTSQRVNLTVVSIDRRGDQGTVVVRRRDTIQAGGRQQVAESQQTLTVARVNGGWVIVEIR